MKPVSCAGRLVTLAVLLAGIPSATPCAASTPLVDSLTPRSGVLATGPVTFVSSFSDDSGSQDIVECRLLINTRLVGYGGIFLRYDARLNRLFLRDDANTVWLGGFAPGSPNQIENKLCVVDCLQSVASGNGARLTVTWRLVLKPAASGSVYGEWLYATDLTSGTPWVSMGEVRVSQVPTNGYMEPNSGKLRLNRDVNLVTAASDGDGGSDIAECRLLLNTQLSGSGGVFLRYDTRTSLLYMRDDKNTAWLGGFLPGSTNTIENSSAILNCRLTTVSGTGLQIRISWRVSVKTVAPGQMLRGWMYVADRWGLGTAWQPMGQFQPDAPPQSVSISPATGVLPAGAYTSLTSTFQDIAGAGDISDCYIFINTPSMGSKGAYALYDANSNLLYLRDDADTEWTGGRTPGTPGILENSYCALDCSRTSVSASGLFLTVAWRILLKPVLAAPAAAAWHSVFDDSDTGLGWEQVGAYVVDRPPVNETGMPPGGLSLSAGQPVTFATRFSDPDGSADISRCYVLLNTSVSGVRGVYLYYDAQANLLFLRNTASTSWSSGVAPGSAGTIENDYVVLYCDQTSVSSAGNTLAINWRILIKPSMTLGATKAWLYSTDTRGLSDGWDEMGVLTLISPANARLTPDSGTLPAGQSFALQSVHSSVLGAAHLTDCRLLVHTAISSAGGVFLFYDPRANRLYLRSDNGGVWLGGGAPGSDSTIANNQCILSCRDTLVTAVGNDLTVSWSLVLQPVMRGRTLGAWMYTADDTGVGVGWQQMGGFTVASPP